METEPQVPECSAGCPSAPSPKASTSTIRALLIDDDRDDYFLTRELLSEVPGGRCTLDWASTYEAGVKAICEGTHDVFLLDYRLGAKTGIDLLKEAHGHGCSGPVILLTGQGHSRTDLDALDAGADDYLEKSGLTPALLERSIRYALAQHSAEVELERKVNERTEELAKANEALRMADRRKDEFLSTLGHELRNPLAPILNALEIMRLACDKADVVVRQRERLERQVAQMVRLVDDLLDVSRVVTGKLRLTPETITLRDVIDAALDLSRPHLDKARLNLVLDVPTRSIRLFADRMRLAQVFSNLLNNTAKYTEAGGRVSLSAALVGERAVVRVKDTGVGIPRDVLPHIFELFTQVDRTLNRSQGGLGVGLALVRRLVEMHRGKVSVHSDGPGTGTEFTVELPVLVD
jgi:signal transduction histidine kinase